MVSDKFRSQLQQESKQWQLEGFIDESMYQGLAERYQFGDLEPSANNRFIGVVVGIGCILLGLGVITFVAANWQQLSRILRIILLMSLFVGVNTAGFYLWRRCPAAGGQQKLGQGFLLTGALILGANMALMSQIFHQSQPGYELYWVWGFGVLAMAYSLRLVSLGILAWILVSIGYLWSNFGPILGVTLETGWINVLQNHMGLLFSVMFVPLAYQCRSRTIFTLAAIGFAVAMPYEVGRQFESTSAPAWLIAIAVILPPAILWAYDSHNWQFRQRPHPQRSVIAKPTDPFQSVARSLSIWLLGPLLYGLSFHWLWQSTGNPIETAQAWQPSWYHLDFLGYILLASLGWLRLSWPLTRMSLPQQKWVNSGLIAGCLVLTGIMVAWNEQLQHQPTAPLLFNIMLFVLAIALLHDGLLLGKRRTFWGGMALLVLGIVSRMLEYNTDLILKSLVFMGCGIGVILAGLAFERRLQRLQPSLPSSFQE